MLIAIPELGSARRILCVQPHYDDNDIGAGGTIAALAMAGAHVTYVTATDDLLGIRDAQLGDEEARVALRAEQERAGREIGVSEQIWLGYPDASAYDYFELRRRIAAQIRRVQPDFVLTVDAWMPYEAHSDHDRVGRATAEAVLLHRLPRFRTEPQIDAAYAGHELRGVAFYMTARPNTVFDVTASRARKHRALEAYRSQWDEGEIRLLQGVLDHKEREWANGQPFSFGEALQVLHPAHLHVNPDAEELLSSPGRRAAPRDPSS
jgi:N,N'-diacetylchitobiose non-reducing end deacetylase